MSKKSLSPIAGPFEALAAWDRTVKFHSFPTWLKVLARRKLRAWGEYEPGMTFHYYADRLVDNRRWPYLLDHWGMRGPRGRESFFVMPYGNPRRAADDFARECGLDLMTAPGVAGAWAPSSFLFEFRPLRLFQQGDHVRLKEWIPSMWQGSGVVVKSAVTVQDLIEVRRDDGFSEYDLLVARSWELELVPEVATV